MSVELSPINLQQIAVGSISTDPQVEKTQDNTPSENRSQITNTSAGRQTDRVSISGEAEELFNTLQENEEQGGSLIENSNGSQNSRPPGGVPSISSKAEGVEANEPEIGANLAEDSQVSREQEPEPGELTEEERKVVEQLKARDREVRIHEQAHLSAAGDLANGPPSFDFQVGPDGKKYAVGGSVDITVSPVANDPQATISRADRIRRAALAPAEPSGQDRQVAAQALQMKAEAQQELQQEATEEDTENTSETENTAQSENTNSPGQEAQKTSSSIGSTNSEAEKTEAPSLSPASQASQAYQQVSDFPQPREEAVNLSLIA